MRVLLINPAMNLAKLGRFSGLLEPMPCIGLAYIAALRLLRVCIRVAQDLRFLCGAGFKVMFVVLPSK